jgi:hypothetical protein
VHREESVVKTSNSLLEYWYAALSSPCGIEVVCNDAEGLKARLYTARKEARDPDLAVIKLGVSPFDPNKVWLMPKARDDAPT